MIRVFVTALVLLVFSLEPAAAQLPDFTDMVKANGPSVVNISTVRTTQSQDRRLPGGDELDEFFRRFMPDRERQPNFRPRSLGSGFIISEDGYVLTNNHVVEGADEVIVRLNDRRELEAEVIGTDPRSDLALLKLDADDLPTVELGESDDLEVGEWVLAIGSPFGFDHSVTAGIVSAKGRSLPTEQNENYVPYIQTDVAINPGNSGGPLFNLEGRVVGINSQIYSNSGGFMGVSFAIPIDVAMEVVDQLKESGRVSRGWLGVEIRDVNRDLAEAFGLDRPYGALVNRVLEDGPAEAGGILPGDIIIEFNGHSIELSSELPHYVGRARANAPADVVVVREGKKMTLELEIGELADLGNRQISSAVERNDPVVLGLAVEDLPAAAQERLGISEGVRVLDVEGPGEKAGLRPGDVITRLNNKVVDNVERFREIASDLPSGRSVPVLIIRGDSPTFLALRVP
jgi:serine protease Do